jgi:hypothetical protein
MSSESSVEEGEDEASPLAGSAWSPEESMRGDRPLHVDFKFSLNPFEKFRRYGRFPFKLFVNVLCVVFLTVQVALYDLSEAAADEAERQHIILKFCSPSSSLQSVERGDFVGLPTSFLWSSASVLNDIVFVVKAYYNMVASATNDMDYFLALRCANHSQGSIFSATCVLNPVMTVQFFPTSLRYGPEVVVVPRDVMSRIRHDGDATARSYALDYGLASSSNPSLVGPFDFTPSSLDEPQRAEGCTPQSIRWSPERKFSACARGMPVPRGASPRHVDATLEDVKTIEVSFDFRQLSVKSVDQSQSGTFFRSPNTRGRCVCCTSSPRGGFGGP